MINYIDLYFDGKASFEQAYGENVKPCSLCKQGDHPPVPGDKATGSYYSLRAERWVPLNGYVCDSCANSHDWKALNYK